MQRKSMQRKSMQRLLMSLGLGSLLIVGMGLWKSANAAPQPPVQSFTGQVREVKIDQCGLEPGTCSGSLVLAQARGQEVDLLIPTGTPIQRGDHRVHLEELGVGNYVVVEAAPFPSPTGNPLGFGPNQPSYNGDNQVGTSAGERPYTLQESGQE
jgi:hypothetical protein